MNYCRIFCMFFLFAFSFMANAQTGADVISKNDWKSPIAGRDVDLIRYLYSFKATDSECRLNESDVKLMLQRDVKRDQYLAKFFNQKNEIFLSVIQEENFNFVGIGETMESPLTLIWGTRCVSAPMDMQILSDWLSGSAYYNDGSEKVSYTFYDETNQWKKTLSKGPWTITYGIWNKDTFEHGDYDIELQTPSSMSVAYDGKEVFTMTLLDVQAFNEKDLPLDYKPFKVM